MTITGYEFQLMTGDTSTSPNDFVLRRAFRFGRVTRSDVIDAFPEFSYSKGGMVLNRCLETHAQALVRVGKSVVPSARATLPAVASEQDLLNALRHGLFEMRFTGLRPEELPIQKAAWLALGPTKPGALLTITHAIAHQSGVEIRYAGLRQGEVARWRQLFPLGLEQVGMQWRLIAQDLLADDFPVKSFVLSRVMDAAPMVERLPKTFVPQSETDRQVTVSVAFDDRLTLDQREVLAHELNIHQGKVTLNARARWEFERQFGGASAHDDVVWPPISVVKDD